MSQNIYQFIGLRFLCGLFHYPVTVIVYVLVSEWIEPKKFATIGLTSVIFFDLGSSVCALSGYIFSYSWRLQFTVLLIPLTLTIFLIYFKVPESAKWLYAKGKIDRCERVLKIVASRNGRSFDSLDVCRPKEQSLKRDIISVEGVNSPINEATSLISDNDTVQAGEYQHKPTSIFSLFETARASILMMVNLSCWFSLSLLYYGLAFNASRLGGNIYINSALLGLTGVPAWLVCVPMNTIGRKPTLLSCLLISTLACALIPCANKYLPGVTLYLALVGKTISTAAFDMMFVYSPEQFPTELRSSGTSVCSAASRLAVMVAPFIIQTGKSADFEPYAIMSTIGMLTFLISALYAIETRNKPQLETVEQYLRFASKN